mmetsp:Transcript_24035/g.59396  ORF Transcript_24035/g.59396 Transcript_24035/m.59396 type:complete len:352 (-) Transcript_24035:1189-2244(-)
MMISFGSDVTGVAVGLLHRPSGARDGALLWGWSCWSSSDRFLALVFSVLASSVLLLSSCEPCCCCCCWSTDRMKGLSADALPSASSPGVSAGDGERKSLPSCVSLPLASAGTGVVGARVRGTGLVALGGGEGGGVSRGSGGGSRSFAEAMTTPVLSASCALVSSPSLTAGGGVVGISACVAASCSSCSRSSRFGFCSFVDAVGSSCCWPSWWGRSPLPSSSSFGRISVFSAAAASVPSFVFSASRSSLSFSLRERRLALASAWMEGKVEVSEPSPRAAWICKMASSSSSAAAGCGVVAAAAGLLADVLSALLSLSSLFCARSASSASLAASSCRSSCSSFFFSLFSFFLAA